MCHSGIIIQLLEKMVLSLPQRHQEIKKKIKKMELNTILKFVLVTEITTILYKIM